MKSQGNKTNKLDHRDRKGRESLWKGKERNIA